MNSDSFMGAGRYRGWLVYSEFGGEQSATRSDAEVLGFPGADVRQRQQVADMRQKASLAPAAEDADFYES